VYKRQGYKLSDELEERIEAIILDKAEEVPSPVGGSVGITTVLETATEDYVDFTTGTVNCDLRGLKIAIDCANGAVFQAAPRAIRKLGADLLVINDTPDGMNINANCGSTHIENLMKFTVENKCDVGLAFDGDADRVLAVDENGRLVDGDKIMSIIGLSMKKKGHLKHDTIVATSMSNLGFDIMGRENGITILKTTVGDRYVLEKMLEGDYIIGGEQSGHIIIRTHNTTGDGLVTALQLLQVLKESGRKLSELASIMNIYPQVLRNAHVDNKKEYNYLDDPVIAEECRRLEEAFKGEGRVLIRPSGTEPLVRVMIEGRDQGYITSKAEELVRLIEERLG